MKKMQPNPWTEAWLDGVVSGASTMSQRKVTSIEKFGGGLAVARDTAKRKGIHLVQLEDDKGNALVAASKHPFKVLA